MPLVAHLSDTHFGTEQPEVVDDILRCLHLLRPEVIVLSGDITQRARASEFRRARAFVDQLPPGKRLILPGNHDLPLNPLSRVLWPLGRFRNTFGPQLEPSLDTPELLIVCVNTTRGWRHKHGEVSPTQIGAVADRLRQGPPEQLKIVVTHQPVQVSRELDEPDRLRRGPRALQAWREAGADLVLGGHIHLPYMLPVLAEGASEGRGPVWVVNAGTAVSRRVRFEAGNSFNLIRPLHYSDRGERLCTVERWDHHPGEGFTPARVHELELPAGQALNGRRQASG
ncbi:metallophosphoesterase [Aquabacterium soli]|uniref:Metallophosphoesterase n=1 Tax=Aquabacterium soli TaxID=2493092 RepID=A0A3R8T0P5_9BURK|nr:metallophosphoesterase [Aquabacterium soli]RRS03409.1 metallophosphoesterase [Aquabacterium soli]